MIDRATYLLASPPTILFLITARGGSKGLPGKNLRQIEGLSLVGYKARAARKFDPSARLIISTDSPDIQFEAAKHGVETPFLRPAELASDTATSASVVQHAMAWIESNEKRTYDAVMLLEPSSPFATPAHFREAITLYTARNADLVVGMRAMEPHSTYVGPCLDNGSIAPIVDKLNRASGLRRQDQGEEWTMNGALYLFRWSAFKATGKIYGAPEKCFGLLMDRYHSIEIESAEDLALATFCAEKGYIDLSPWGLPTAKEKP
ncbi:MAG: acylneuraminate cytidylyltransferase family protein [Rhodospirillaceae bacterium]|nr:MAG: acylneuraminate cytidylyltransferase family protein [Rhodospirillaceae bacterium]